MESVFSFRRLIKAGQGGGIPPIRGCVPTIIAVFYYGTRATGSDQAKTPRGCVLSLHFYVPTCLREYLHTRYTTTDAPAFLASASLFLGLIVAYLGSSERYFGGTKLISGRGENRSGCVGEEGIRGFSGNEKFEY